MEDISPRQRDVVDFICSTVAQRGIPPTYREIGDALGIASTNGVADHVKALIRKGYLKKVGGSPGGLARGIQLTSKARSVRRSAVVPVPLLRAVDGSVPALTEGNYEKTLHLDRSLVPVGELFAVHVLQGAFLEDHIMVVLRDATPPRCGLCVWEDGAGLAWGSSLPEGKTLVGHSVLRLVPR